jgi:hypothetical protein
MMGYWITSGIYGFCKGEGGKQVTERKTQGNQKGSKSRNKQARKEER